ncbi:subtilisin-like protease SBT4.3 [Tanacetum coccineum]
MMPYTSVYIVFVGSLPQHPYLLAFHHSKIIKDIVPPSFAKKSLLRSYKYINRFSAKLTKKESDKLRNLDNAASTSAAASTYDK